MKAHHKHHNLARRKMGHIIDEIYTALLHYGGGEVDLRILRQAEGLRLFAKSEFAPEHLEDIRRMDLVVGIASGPEKAEAIHAALCGRLLNVLITDYSSIEPFL